MHLDKWIVGAVVIFGALCWGSVHGQQSASKPIAGLISELSGEASIRSSAGAKAGSAQRFAAIDIGTIVATGPKSRAVIVLAGGQRFELGSNARATIAATRLTATSGPVNELPALSPLPKLVALDESGPKGPAGGIRLRGTEMVGLRPADSVTLPERTILRFTPVAGASRYGLEIEDVAGQRIFSAESTTASVSVPAGILAPQSVYYWTVRTLDKAGATVRGAAEFRTLSSEDGRLRQALRGSIDDDVHGDALAFLAEVDRRLGLYQEALDGFRAALARRPDDVTLQQAVRRLENGG
jgi:hypothetical protein